MMSRWRKKGRRKEEKNEGRNKGLMNDIMKVVEIKISEKQWKKELIDKLWFERERSFKWKEKRKRWMPSRKGRKEGKKEGRKLKKKIR